MDRTKIRLIIIGVIGVVVLIIGIGEARIYTQTYSMEVRDIFSDYLYDRNYNELNRDEKVNVERYLDNYANSRKMSIKEKNLEFRE